MVIEYSTSYLTFRRILFVKEGDGVMLKIKQRTSPTQKGI